MKRHWLTLLTAITVIALSGCAGVPSKDVPSAEAVTIQLGDTITVNGSGAMVDGRNVTIIAGGTYSISGTLNDGQIFVNTKDKDAVKLILNGARIASSRSAPIYAQKVQTMIIALADGTDNYISDADSYITADSQSNEPNAAIFSKGDLIIEGNGSLTVDAHYDNGITSKDALNITGGHITVNSVSDGIKGRDNLVINDGNITVNAKADGLQSDNDEDLALGFVSIQGGTLDITAAEDGIQAETRVVIGGGTTTISSGGGSSSSSPGNTMGNGGTGSDSQNSASAARSKGIKAAVDVTIEGGTVRVDSGGDAINSKDRLKINGGNIVLAAEDDGVHADSTLEINGGDLTVTKCYEGIESAVVTINAGSIHVASSDDGINAAGGSNNNLSINGGYVVIDAGTDGLDANGIVALTGGAVIINGPVGNDNSAVDDDGGFKITGGTLVGVSGSGMAQAPDAISTQYSVVQHFSAVQPAGTIVRVQTREGDEILTFAPKKAYHTLLLSSPELKHGSTYNIYSGGSSTGTATDGLYSGGEYSAGTQTGSFTISSLVTMP